MEYDFTTLPERFTTNAYKWQETQKDKEVLPLWIADMDFVVFPEMTEALEVFAKTQVFGYDAPKDSLYQAIVDWESTQHDYIFAKEALLFIQGVVPAISVAIQAFSKEGEAVLINTPVYPPFARTVEFNKRRLISNSLVERHGHFEIDFERLEKDIVENDVKIYVLCNPHNPGGRVWSKEELRKIGQLCHRYDVILVSDEIHQDLTLYGNKHHSINTVDTNFKDFSIVLTSATKTFNIAGTKNSFAIIENAKLRENFSHQQLINNQHDVSTLGLLATEVAYTKGKAWLQALKPVLEDNINEVVDTLRQKTAIKVMKPEGTYLVWLDFSAYNLPHEELHDKIRHEAKLVLNDGRTFGVEGKQHFRLNVAAPKSVIREALERLVRVFAV
ncbi:MalY/PatB family protein [Streptococcus sciuri]|uniref:cysteine-S-conjugate beta-lyase n=1 Tax=Streptococcus sciuri TaxID=2973939 RepID=A0ABT2F8J4_9STRE|nr:MalY/PatB family protein [Streptococcus sciuri]MCS4488754.1 pyridoxal phosphate-dependent aminotransferase [Streptococcus sciuri]